MTFGLIGAAIQSLDTVADMCALLLLKGGSGAAALPVGQAQALALVLLRMHSLIYDLALVFFGGFSVLTGALVLKSSFLPRVIGVLMTLDGLGYLAYQSITFKDYPVMQIIVMLLSAIYVVLTLASDLANAWLDPRIRVA